MGKLTKRFLLAGALTCLGLAMQAQPTWASDTDCSGAACTFFTGANVTGGGGTISSAISPGAGKWTGTFSEQVYLNSGVYTYVFDLVMNTNPGNDTIGSVSTGLGASNGNFFSNLLDWGVITLSNPLSAAGSTGADDSPEGSGFNFSGGSTLLVGLSGMNKAGNEIEFYAQSHLGPGAGQFNAIDGGTSSTDALDPGPEPRSILLFGTGLLMLGVFLRRRLPQLPQLR